jgi:predicted phosphodiesterase
MGGSGRLLSPVWVIGLIALSALLVLAVAELREGSKQAPIKHPAIGASNPFVDSIARRRAVVWAVGDGADGRAAGRRVARMIASRRVDVLLYLGDVYDDGTAAEFNSNYETTYGGLSSLTAPTVGNHEAAQVAEGYGPYWRRVHGVTPPAYYAFRVAGWKLLSLNSEIAHGRHSRQARWLRHKTSTGGNCRIAFWHRPRYSDGTFHGDQPDTAPLWNALRGRARIVINGHEHDMQAFRARDGLVELISGAGGAGLYPVDRSDPRLAFASGSSYGAVRLSLRRSRARYAFVTATGHTLHRGRVRCHR